MSLASVAVRYFRDDLAIEVVAVEETGLVRASGWSVRDGAEVDAIDARFDDAPPVRVTRYREWRPDVREARRGSGSFAGWVLEFQAGSRECRVVTLRYRERTIAKLKGPFTFVEPDYGVLLDSSDVWPRSAIYTSGPPPEAFNEPALDLALEAPGRILDFGCGSGAYLRALRARGRDVEGLELDTPAIRGSLKPDVAPHVHLHDGRLPLPFQDASYDSCIAFEVLEHIPAFREVIPELARVTRDTLVVTVPDASAIPRMFPHHAVPWHMLEATHVNFFTQESLSGVLAPHFRIVDMARICPFPVNGTVVYTSVAAVCRRR